MEPSDPPPGPKDPADPDSYETLAGPSEAEIKVQRSRFLAIAAPASTLVEAKQVVAEVVRRYHDCRHVCYAWRGGTGSELQEVRNDGGEPAGTAGGPILKSLRQMKITDCVAVVARYFGGVKLGTGGLARAYSNVTAAVLAEAELRTVKIGCEFTLCLAYTHQKNVACLLERYGGRTLNEKYSDKVAWQIWLPRSRWREFAAALTEATSGQVAMKTPA